MINNVIFTPKYYFIAHLSANPALRKRSGLDCHMGSMPMYSVIKFKRKIQENYKSKNELAFIPFISVNILMIFENFLLPDIGNDRNFQKGYFRPGGVILVFRPGGIYPLKKREVWLLALYRL